jgi:hypothetical protein
MGGSLVGIKEANEGKQVKGLRKNFSLIRIDKTQKEKSKLPYINGLI